MVAFDKYGTKALEECAKKQPASFLKLMVLLVPREMKHSITVLWRVNCSGLRSGESTTTNPLLGAA
jgi:hypothetical protein